MTVTKKIIAFILSITMIVQVFCVDSIYADTNNDYSNHWAAQTIERLLGESIITGYDDGSIKPDNEITRAEFVTLTNKLFGYTDKASSNFKDVNRDVWYAEQFLIAKQAGYVQGDNNGYANPTKNITRAEVCTIIAQALNLESVNKTDFTDDSAIPTWAKGFIGAMSDGGLINGYPDGSFNASKNITRAEAFVIINNVLDKLKEISSNRIDENNNSNNEDNIVSEETTQTESSETTTAIIRRAGGGGGGGGGSTSSSNIYYTVTFDANGVGDVINLPSVQTVRSGSHATVPASPTRPNYIFDGWYIDSSLETPYDFNSAVTANIILYAKWVIMSNTGNSDSDYTVTFMLNDGTDSVYELQRVSSNETATKPSDPVRDKYGFTGWYTESQAAVEFDFSTPIDADVVLYAGWGSPDGREGVYSVDSGSETNYSITGIEMQDRNVVTTLNANSASILLVSFLDENTEELINSVAIQTPSYCELEAVSIPIDFELPEYFLIKAILLDDNENELCDPFVSIKYTSEYAVFDSQTVNDFDEEKVINFDSDETDNFGVFADGVIKVDVYTDKNILEVVETEISDDPVPEFTYIFRKPDSTITSLEVGNNIFINGTNYLFKIGSIDTDTDGSIIMTPSHDVALSDFYDVLKVDMKSDSREGQNNENGVQTVANVIDTNANLSGSNSVSVDFTPADWLEISGKVSGKISVDFEIVYDVHLFTKDYFCFSVTATDEISLNPEIEIKADNGKMIKEEFEACKIKIKTPIPGLDAYQAITLPIELSASATYGFEYTINNTKKLVYDTNNGLDTGEKKETITNVTKAEGKAELKFGPKASFGIEFLGEIVKVSLNTQAGINASATLSYEEYNDEDYNFDLESQHSCALCVAGDVKWFIDVYGEFSFCVVPKILEFKDKITIIKVEAPILFVNKYPGEFYFSLINNPNSIFGGHPKFGGGECPNKIYRTYIIVKDTEGEEVKDVDVEVVRPGYDYTSSGKSPYVVFLYNGHYNARCSINGIVSYKEFDVKNSAQNVAITPLSANGRLEGKIVDSVTNEPVNDAYIVVEKGNEGVKAEQSHEDGSFGISLASGSYNIIIVKDGYKPFYSYETIDSGETKYMETVKLVSGENKSGGFSGTITDSSTGYPLEGVKLEVRKGWNNSNTGDILKVLTTDENGKYDCSGGRIHNIPVGLESGNYTVTASKEGYITSSFNVVVLPEVLDNENQNASISPEGTEGEYKIILSWGEYPEDLDSHVVGSISNGNTFHTYFYDQNAYDGNSLVCNLDVDDVTSYGPETITLNTSSDKPYYYFIYRFAGSGTVATSGAKIEVYKQNSLVRTFNVPVNGGDGDYWNVFAIVNGNLTVKNTITDEADLSYAGGNFGDVSVYSLINSSSISDIVGQEAATPKENKISENYNAEDSTVVENSEMTTDEYESTDISEEVELSENSEELLESDDFTISEELISENTTTADEATNEIATIFLEANPSDELVQTG